MNRRRFLASGAALAVAAAGGCTGCARSPSASLSMDPVTDAAVVERVTSDLAEEGNGDRYTLIRDTVANGSATVERTEPPLPEGVPFVYAGAVYELAHEVVSSTPSTSFQITLNPADGDPDPAEVVRFEALPAVDRRKFEARGWDGEFLGFGTTMLYLDDEIPASALVPDPERPIIEWDSETRGRFTVDGSYDRPLHTYRYTAELLYESAADLGETLRERYAFTLSGLENGEREIVETAISDEGGYTAPPDEAVPEAMSRLAARFREHEQVPRLSELRDGEVDDEPTERDADAQSASGTYLVRYRGQVYYTSLFVRESTTTAS
ncbi:hypothetical protein ACFO0N_21800 [Halobium salinum]|uniref:Tat (Twin-arginine translocation) pathway signal sequence n=1 Tax=Halobium salinum TaxID=1364940 RepID=A0ABD5PIL0_9EURY|nr:hypothetical protein [Halobium salinum]